jgi:hypothetical protein
MAGSWLAGSGQREVRLDLVAVAVAVFLLDDLAGCGRAGDDAVGAAFGMPRLTAASRNRGPGRARCIAGARAGRPGSSCFSSMRTGTVSGNVLLVSDCGCRLGAGTGN